MSKEKLQEAENSLHNLEKHKHAAATSHFRMKRSERLMHEFGDDVAEAAKHKADFEKHRADKQAALAAHANSGITDRDIDQAAQAVLDARALVGE